MERIKRIEQLDNLHGKLAISLELPFTANFTLAVKSQNLLVWEGKD